MKQTTYLTHVDLTALRRPDLNAEHLDEARRNAGWEIDLLHDCAAHADPVHDPGLARALGSEIEEIKSLPGMQEEWL